MWRTKRNASTATCWSSAVEREFSLIEGGSVGVVLRSLMLPRLVGRRLQTLAVKAGKE
jgi:hypothetical protein